MIIRVTDENTRRETRPATHIGPHGSNHGPKVTFTRGASFMHVKPETFRKQLVRGRRECCADAHATLPACESAHVNYHMMRGFVC